MTRIPFTKAQATGNDFVMLADGDDVLALGPDEIVALCDRHTGVGADGVIRAVRSLHLAAGREVLELEPQAEWFMDYSNADGSIAEMCGNGVRAFARFLLERKLADFDDDGILAVATRAGVKYVRRVGDDFEVDLGRWRLAGGEPLVDADGLDVARPALGVDVGNPHVVVALSSANELDGLDLRVPPQIDPAPISGANVEFVVPCEPFIDQGTGHVEMRVHERGVGETRSCGTGVAATALAVRYWAGDGAPMQWRVTVPGGTLTVRIVRAVDGEHVMLAGPAVCVFDGEIDLGR